MVLAAMPTNSSLCDCSQLVSCAASAVACRPSSAQPYKMLSCNPADQAGSLFVALECAAGLVKCALHLVPCLAVQVGLMLEVGNSAAERHPAWRILTARPKSAIGQLTISWRLPMSDLAALIDRTIDSEGPPEIFTAPAVVWAGCRVQAWVCGLKGKAALGAWHAEPAAADAVCAFAARATMSVRDRPAEVVELHNYDGRLVVSSGTPSSFAEVFMIVLDVQSGIEAERRLNEQGVVQRDGCVHFKLQLTDPLM